jgi:hypothetical protein
VNLFDQFLKPGGARLHVKVPVSGAHFTLQIGAVGADAQAAVQDIAKIAKRQKVSKRLGAQAVIRAERG